MSSDPHKTVSATPPGPEVIRLAQQGDANAFATLFHAHKKRIYSLCLRMTDNAAEAEDLTQDAFLQVFRKLSSFRGDSAFSTWLHRVAVNTVLMHFRKKSPCRISLDDTTDHYEDGRPVAREYEVRDHRLEASVNRVALARAISALSDGYRTVFLLHDVEGYEHHEIADLLGCSAGTSKSQLHKARMRIRNFLAGSREAQTETGSQEERPSTMRGRFQSAYSSSR